ncbi:MAG: family 10 glycosylhydrolase [Richelia sp. SM2_1_7]|nr:family 10 glycosylhydrolase [Richelia sp. SM2_1_7]
MADGGTRSRSGAFYDPLALLIEHCHLHGIEVHAWLNPYRATYNIEKAQAHESHLLNAHPEWILAYGKKRILNPGLPQVRQHIVDIVADLVTRYDLDGIHFDDYFYPYPEKDLSINDLGTYAQYNHKQLSLADWRRDNVDKLIKQVADVIQQHKPLVKFGISPFGIYRPGEPNGIQGLDAYSVLYADAKKWLQEGWLDYIAPQLYWRIDQTAQSYPILLEWWTSINSKQRHVYAGNTIARLDGEAWKQEEIIKQVAISRSLNKSLSLGNIFFSVNAIKENRQNIADKFKSLLYKEPALVPVMQWQNTLPPASPIKVETKNRKITWATGGGEIRSWTLYKKSGNDWKLQRILSKGTTAATVEPGTYAVCAVDRMAVQSSGVIISV